MVPVYDFYWIHAGAGLLINGAKFNSTAGDIAIGGLCCIYILEFFFPTDEHHYASIDAQIIPDGKKGMVPAAGKMNMEDPGRWNSS